MREEWEVISVRRDYYERVIHVTLQLEGVIVAGQVTSQSFELLLDSKKDPIPQLGDLYRVTVEEVS